MSRFKLVEAKDLKNKISEDELSELENYGEFDCPEILWDDKKEEVAFVCSPEPEDATLHRDYWPLVSLLNEVSDESNN